MSRQYLTRLESMGQTGIWCASLIPKAKAKGIPLPEMRVACRLADGTVIEAEGTEAFHAEIRLRIQQCGPDVDDGFTVDTDALARLQEEVA